MINLEEEMTVGPKVSIPLNDLKLYLIRTALKSDRAKYSVGTDIANLISALLFYLPSQVDKKPIFQPQETNGYRAN